MTALQPLLRVVVLSAAVLVLATSAPLEARQGAPVCDQGHCLVAYDDWRGGTGGQLAALGANVLAGGLTAGIRRWRSDGSFRDGFWRGAVGGAGTYLGKRIVTEATPGAGILGRGVAAVGSSVSRNAAHGAPSFQDLILPIGPVRLHWSPGVGELGTSVDLFAVGSLIWVYSADLGASLDLRRTLESGALVWTASDWERSWGWHARQVGGGIVVRGDEPGTREHGRFVARALSHERIHVIQYDQAYILWSEPVERRILEGVGLSPGS
jgi:hypothetical protein